MRKRPGLKRCNWWGITTGLASFLPALTLFLVPTDSKQTIMVYLTWVLVAGVTIGGAGQALRAVTHNGNRTADGVGKVLGFTGWAISLTSLIIFALQRAEVGEDGKVFGALIAGWVAIGLTVIALSVWGPLRRKEVPL